MQAKKLIIFGIEDFAQIAYEYFTNDSEYEAVAFTVHRDYVKESTFMGLPLIPFEDLVEFYPPSENEIYCAIVYGNLNRDRERVAKEAKDMGYKLASYISSNSFVAPSARIGEHCFVFEDNTVQPFAEIGNNCVLWSGNHCGHHSRIGDNVFVSSHVVISGHCKIGDNCFIGVNSTLANGTNLGKESWVSHGCVLSGNIPEHSMVKSVPSQIIELNEAALLRSLERARK